jgi:hypothetical protein
MAADDWAIVVGVRSYPGLGDLDGPENDARAFHEWVTSARGGQVPPGQVTLILSSNYRPPFPSVVDAEPTAERVERAFDRLTQLAEDNSRQGKGLRAGRRLYLYLAGHGCAPAFEEAALLMANATRLRAGYHIPGRPWANWFFRSGYFDEVVLFMDCCRESYPQAPLNLPPYIDRTAPDAISVGRRFYGFGTKWSRLTREKPINGVPRGVFTVALIEGLNGAAAEPDGRVTAASLGDYLYNGMRSFLTEAELKDPEVPKEPDLVYDPHAGRSFVLVTAEPPRFLVRVRLPDNSGGQVVQVLSSLRFRQEQAATATPPVWEVQLPRGMYLVQIPGMGKQAVVEVNGTGGVDVTL